MSRRLAISRRLPLALPAAALLLLGVAGPAAAGGSRTAPGTPTISQVSCTYSVRGDSYLYNLRLTFASTGGKPVTVQAKGTFPTSTATVDFSGALGKVTRKDLNLGYVDLAVSTQSAVTGPATAVWGVAANSIGSTSSASDAPATCTQAA